MIRFVLPACFFLGVPALPVLGGEPVLPGGDASLGKTVFEAQRCNRCHSVQGAGFDEEDLPARPRVHLGEERHENWSRDDFARAMMAPSHSMNPEYQRMAREAGDVKGAEESPMPHVLDTLTVRQLIDIAAFLAESVRSTP